MKTADIRVSIGRSINQTCGLGSCTISEHLNDRRTKWQTETERVRRLPHRSKQQRTAKVETLGYVTWAGIFTERQREGLAKHSGVIAIDVDDLTPAQCHKAITRATEDNHCFAAFTSVSGRGVWLLFRVEPVPAARTHATAFHQVAKHVKEFYKVKPDYGAGKDVSRACFFSHDERAYTHFKAAPLPVDLTQHITTLAPKHCRKERPVAHPVPLSAPQPTESNFSLKHFGVLHLGRNYAPIKKKPNGTVYTHRSSLFRLGKAVAMLIAKEGLSEIQATAVQDKAFFGWSAALQREEHKVTHGLGKYRQELGKIVRSSLKRPGMPAAATKWTRWLEHPNFPTNGDPEQRLLFAIRQHCKAERNKVFFIGCRDAAKIARVKSTRTAAKLLQEFRRCKILSTADDKNYAMPRFNQRHARKYRLLG